MSQCIECVQRREQRERVLEAVVGVVNRRAKDVPMSYLAPLLWLLGRLPSSRARKLVPTLADAFSSSVLAAIAARPKAERAYAREQAAAEAREAAGTSIAAEAKVERLHGARYPQNECNANMDKKAASADAGGAARALFVRAGSHGIVDIKGTSSHDKAFFEVDCADEDKSDDGEIKEEEDMLSVPKPLPAHSPPPAPPPPASLWLQTTFGRGCCDAALGLTSIAEVCGATPFRGGLFLSGSRHVPEKVAKSERNIGSVDGRAEETTGLPSVAVRALEGFAALPVEWLKGALIPAEAVPLLAAYTILGLPVSNMLSALLADASETPASFNAYQLCTLAWAAAASPEHSSSTVVMPLVIKAHSALMEAAAIATKSAEKLEDGVQSPNVNGEGARSSSTKEHIGTDMQASTDTIVNSGLDGGHGQIVDAAGAPIWRAIRKTEALSTSHELAAARLAWAVAAIDARDLSALDATASLIPLINNAPCRSVESVFTTSWYGAATRVQPSVVGALLHQYHLWATTEARKQPLALPAPLASRLAEGFHAQW